jgi:uncharacterized protein (UPF0332 family)
MLSDGILLFTNGRYESAIDRAYYAMFHAAHAALSGIVVRQPKSHNGLRLMLLMNRVNQGVLESSYVTDLRRAFEARQSATYEANLRVEEASVIAWLDIAERFVARMRRLIEEGVR